MKAGILTFHRALNYGAVLQTFALSRAVCSLGAECKVIDYRSEPLEDTYKVFNFKTTASAATWSYAPDPVMEHNSKNPSIPDLEQVK